jgi:hypothetical protein
LFRRLVFVHGDFIRFSRLPGPVFNEINVLSPTVPVAGNFLELKQEMIIYQVWG